MSEPFEVKARISSIGNIYLTLCYNGNIKEQEQIRSDYDDTKFMERLKYFKDMAERHNKHHKAIRNSLKMEGIDTYVE